MCLCVSVRVRTCVIGTAQSSACTLCGRKQSLLHVLNHCDMTLCSRHYDQRDSTALKHIVEFIRVHILGRSPNWEEEETWRTVLSVLEKAGCKAFSQQLQTEVLHLQWPLRNNTLNNAWVLCKYDGISSAHKCKDMGGKEQSHFGRVVGGVTS